MDEILEQSPERPAAIVTSVGGGGLLCGILKGLHRLGNVIPWLAYFINIKKHCSD